MVTKHFFKILIIFSVMIILGLIGVFLVNRFGNNEDTLNNVGVAK